MFSRRTRYLFLFEQFAASALAVAAGMALAGVVFRLPGQFHPSTDNAFAFYFRNLIVFSLVTGAITGVSYAAVRYASFKYWLLITPALAFVVRLITWPASSVLDETKFQDLAVLIGSSCNDVTFESMLRTADIHCLSRAQFTAPLCCTIGYVLARQIFEIARGDHLGD
jgi:hypothetical protein